MDWTSSYASSPVANADADADVDAEAASDVADGDAPVRLAEEHRAAFFASASSCCTRLR